MTPATLYAPLALFPLRKTPSPVFPPPFTDIQSHPYSSRICPLRPFTPSSTAPCFNSLLFSDLLRNHLAPLCPPAQTPSEIGTRPNFPSHFRFLESFPFFFQYPLSILTNSPCRHKTTHSASAPPRSSFFFVLWEYACNLSPERVCHPGFFAAPLSEPPHLSLSVTAFHRTLPNFPSLQFPLLGCTPVPSYAFTPPAFSSPLTPRQLPSSSAALSQHKVKLHRNRISLAITTWAICRIARAVFRYT